MRRKTVPHKAASLIKRKGSRYCFVLIVVIGLAVSGPLYTSFPLHFSRKRRLFLITFLHWINESAQYVNEQDTAPGDKRSDYFQRFSRSFLLSRPLPKNHCWGSESLPVISELQHLGCLRHGNFKRPAGKGWPPVLSEEEFLTCNQLAHVSLSKYHIRERVFLASLGSLLSLLFRHHPTENFADF